MRKENIRLNKSYNSKRQQESELPLFKTSEDEQVIIREKNFRIPNEDVKIRYNELMVVNTRTFQRLYDIKQLGLAYLVYPFATHTRAAHSIDCLHWAQKIINCLKKNLSYSNFHEKDYFLNHIKDNENLIRLAALLHDISHIPFSHTLEDENLIFEEHDKGRRLKKIMSSLRDDIKSLDEMETPQLLFRLTEEKYDKMKEDLLKSSGLLDNVDRVLSFNDKDEKLGDDEKNMYYITDIIGNTICADLLSYTTRDTEMAGTEGKAAGAYRLFDYFEIRRDDKGRARLVIKLTKENYPRHDVIPIICEILDKRYALAYQITYHHAKLVASAMLGKIVQLANLKELEKFYEVGDEGFLNLLGKIINTNMDNPNLIIEEKRSFEMAKKLLKNLRSRRLYKRFYIIPYSDRNIPPIGNLEEILSKPEGYTKLRELEKEVEKIGLNSGDVIFFCPKMDFKEVETMVVYEDSKGEEKIVKLNSTECKEFVTRHFDKSLSDKISNIESQYNALWKLYVFINPEKIRLYGDEILKRLDKKFKGRGIYQFKKYWSKTAEYKISEGISEEVEMADFDIRARVYQKLPEALEGMAVRAKTNKKKNVFYTEDIIKGSAERAKELIDE